MQPKNLQQAFDLARRYNTVTLDEIAGVWVKDSGYETAKILTGLGNPFKCLICIVHDGVCDGCIYPEYTGDFCSSGINQETCYAMVESKTPEQLYAAYRARAQHIYTIIAKHISDRIKKIK